MIKFEEKINIWFHNNSNSNDKYSIFLYVRKHYLIIQFQFFQIIKESRNQERRILISWHLPDHEEFSWIVFVNLSWSRRIFVNIGAVDISGGRGRSTFSSVDYTVQTRFCLFVSSQSLDNIIYHSMGEMPTFNIKKCPNFAN